MTKAKRNAQTKPVPVTGGESISTERKKPFSKSMGREKIKSQILERDPTREYQSTRFSYYGELFVQNLPQWRLWTGRMMLTSDPLVNFSLNVRNAALGAAEVQVTSPNPRIQEWVQRQWDYLWNQHRSKLVSAKKWGFAPLQMLFKTGKDGLLEINGVKDFAPEDCRGLESNGKLVGHRVKGNPIYFPQACWLTFGAEFGSPYGHGTLRRSYPAWYEKWMDHGAKRLMQLRMIKDSYIGDIFWYPPNMLVELPDGTKMSWRDLMREMGENRLSGGAITMPMLYDNNGKELTKYTPPQDTGSASQIFEWNESCDEGILRGADVPVEVVKASDTGSGYSGRSIPFLVVLSVCTQELVEIIQRVDEQVLQPLAWLNFGGEPEYEITPVSLVDSFSNDTAGSPMGGGAIGGQPSATPQQAVPLPQQQGQQFNESGFYPDKARELLRNSGFSHEDHHTGTHHRHPDLPGHIAIHKGGWTHHTTRRLAHHGDKEFPSTIGNDSIHTLKHYLGSGMAHAADLDKFAASDAGKAHNVRRISLKGYDDDHEENQFEEMAHPKAPPGGVTLQGKFYKGGVFIPKEVLDKLSKEDKEKLHPKHHKAPEDLEHVSHLGGSTGADLMKDKTGNQWVQKKGASEGHAKNEHEANELYKKMGVPVPASHYKDGKLITEHIKGTPLNELTGDAREHAYDKLRKHFVADALLGNWDVIGLAYDNVIVDHKGVPHRVDNGGSLAYRAKGASKGGSWNTELSELDSMRTMGIAGQVFGKVTDADIKEQGTKILKLAEDGVFDNADPILKGRLESLKKRINAISEPASKASKMVDNYDYATIKSGYESLVHHIGPNLLTKIQARKIAIANVGGDTSKLIIGTTIPPNIVQKLKDLYPTKQVVIKSSAGYIAKTKAKFGLASTKELWNAPLTTFEKGLAAEAAKAGKIPETLNKQIQSLPTAEKPKEQTNKPMKGFEAPHFKRPDVQSNGTIAYKEESGNYDAIKTELKSWEVQYQKAHASVGYGPIESFKASGVAIRKAEAAALADGGGYKHTGVKPDPKQAAVLKEWTDKAPKYHGVVYRGIRHVVPGTEAYAALTTVGGIVDFAASAHTSRHPTTPFSFGAEKILMRIATKSGVDVRNIGNYDSEKEVIVPAGTKFKVVGVHHNVTVNRDNGKKFAVSSVFVDLEEVEAHQYAFSEK